MTFERNACNEHNITCVTHLDVDYIYPSIAWHLVSLRCQSLESVRGTKVMAFNPMGVLSTFISVPQGHFFDGLIASYTEFI